MSTDFKVLKTAISAQFQKMQKHPLYRTKVGGEALWNTYLASFPEGGDPIYRERTEHDCSACRSFIKAVGNCVTIINNKIVSLWDVEVSEPIYQTVVNAMSAMVKSQDIDNIFLHTESKAGIDSNFEQVLSNTVTWHHFFVNLSIAVVRRGTEIGPQLSDARSTHDVMLRGLKEITTDAIATVLDLMSQNSLYRGEEHKRTVTEFEGVKIKFDMLTTDLEKDLYVWSNMKTLSGTIARVRNSAIGALLVSLSEGKDLDASVRMFEAIVAPQNYQRPTALVTKAMVAQAQAKIEELGLMSALSRRHAVLGDITAANVLHADRTARNLMADNVFEEITASLPEKAKNYDKVEEVTIEKFLEDVLPRAQTVEVFLDNRLSGNLVSLIAPVDPTAGNLFKWDNNFTWDYAGGFADSIKERVKKAGGSVEGDLCCRLGWFNTDDLDLHMREPAGNDIYYASKQSMRTGGKLDVDMNAGTAVRNPVENIYYEDRRKMTEGVYTLFVDQFRCRESTDVGFEIEFDYLGDVKRFTYNKQVSGRVTVVSFNYSHARGIEIIDSLPSTEVSRTLWGLPTQAFHKTNVVMFSPNHWDGQGVGNRHYFFMLQGAVRDDAARGFYNEFLKNDLTPHRKAFEMVGSRMKSEGTSEQLSGLGFSSTQKNHVLVRVKGATLRVMKVTF